MSRILKEPICAVNLGTDVFARALREQGVEAAQLRWQPPRALDAEVEGALRVLDGLREAIDAANAQAFDRMTSADPYWVGMGPAMDVVPDMREGVILHAGPPIDWADMTDTQRQGGINGVLFEGYAKTEAEARRMLERGEVLFASANDFHIVAPGTGIATPSMVLNVVEDRNSGARGFCAPFEGPNRGGLAGWGVYNERIRSHLHAMRDELGPAFTRVLEKNGGIALRRMIVRGVEMGDELHTRQDACGLLLVNELAKLLADSDLDGRVTHACLDLIYGTVRFFHPLGMAAAMALLEGVRQVPHATVVTAMEGNGVEFGIKLAGLGNRWFNAPAPVLRGEVIASDLAGDSVLPWCGDSCMLEAAGLGGFAAAAAPAVLRALGKSFAEGVEQTREMARIALGEHPYYRVPALDYAGTPTGIDMRKVLCEGVEPVIHGGMMSRGGKRLGAGSTRVPMQCFEKAALAFAAQYGKERRL